MILHKPLLINGLCIFEAATAAAATAAAATAAAATAAATAAASAVFFDMIIILTIGFI
jgi:hypothetical protein